MGRTIDFTGVGDYKPAPVGTYTLELTKHSVEETKKGANAGSEYIKAQLTITDEMDPEGLEKVEGKTIFDNWSLLPQALWKFYQAAQAFGIPAERLTGQVDIDAILADMHGRRALGDVTISTYAYPEGHAKFGQTRTSNQVDNYQQADIPEALSPASRRRG